MTSIETRNQAYLSILDSLGEKRRIVYQAIKHMRGATNHQIAEFLNWPINCVTGRVSELRKMFLIKSERKNGNTFSGNDHAIWEITESVEEWELLMKTYLKGAKDKLQFILSDIQNESISEVSKIELRSVARKIKVRIKKVELLCESLHK